MKTKSLNKTLNFCVILVALVVLFLPTQGFAEQASQVWLDRFNLEVGPSRDGASSMVMDDLGNVYVTGGVNRSATGCDYATVKYDADGIELWVAYYNGSGKTNDFATSIAVDVSANIYVTGVSWQNITTVKYDSEGHQLWKATYAPLSGVIPGNLNFFPMHQTPSVAVDGSGNVYVAGTQMTLDGSDYVTIKYNASGTQAWLKTYDTPSNPDYDIDVATQVALDDSGNAYVTGFVAQNSPYDYGYATIKYNPAGTRLWVVVYEAQALMTMNGFAFPSMAVDGSGNVYVTGPRYEGSGSEMDYATIKYDTNGNQLWVAVYDGPGNGDDVSEAIALDTDANVYVTGYSEIATGRDYATIKYDSDGNQIWLIRYDGSLDLSYGGIAVTTDLSGNVFVTGQSQKDYATVKYDADGNELWAAEYNGPGNGEDGPTALAVDTSGNVHVTGCSTGDGTGEDYATITYDSNGNELWVARKEGTGAELAYDTPTDMAVDGSGNVYVTGSVGVEGVAEMKAVTVKYNTGGDRLWVVQESDDLASAMAIDGSGNVYVTGREYIDMNEYITVKYDPDGNKLWEARYGQTGLDEPPTDIVVDSVGNVCVTGRVTVKYDPSGNELWVALYRASSMAVDNFGNVYLTGHSSSDYRTVKLDPNGSELWVARYNGPGGGEDEPSSLGIDNSGNVYVTGKSGGSDGHYDYATIKYGPDGNELWAARYSGGDNIDDRARSLGIGPSGTVYVTGFTGGVPDETEFDFATIKYDTDGNELWVTRYDGPGTTYSADAAESLALDAAGNVYVTGSSVAGIFEIDYATIKYDANGTQVWLVRYTSGTATYDVPIKVALDNASNVYVTGVSASSSQPESFLTIKYKQVETQPPWGTASIVGSAALNGRAVQASEALNHISMLLIPIGTVCLLRLFPRREKK